jgi:hypothetical protein
MDPGQAARRRRDRLRAFTFASALAVLAGLPLLTLLLGLFPPASPLLLGLAALEVVGLWVIGAAWLAWLAALAALRGREDAARGERRRADRRWNAAAGMGLLFLGGGGALLGLRSVNLLLLLVGLLHFAAAGLIALFARRPDPWAYDPDLDGPIAQELAGRSFPPPPAPLPQQAGRTALWLLLAVAFLLAGVWLVDVAGQVYGRGNGAEAPSLAALALYLCAACFMAAGPWMGWLALRARS